MSARQEAVYYLGPESVVYHEHRHCPALRGPWRYYECREARGSNAAAIRAKRRPCKRCAT